MHVSKSSHPRTVAFLRGLAAVLLLAWSSGVARAQSPPAAIINGHSISEEEVDAPIAAKILTLDQQRYALRKSSLDNLIAAVLIRDEAAKRGISAQDLTRELSGGEVTVTDEEVERAYLDHADAFAAFGGDEGRQRIRLDLTTQKKMRNYRAAIDELRRGAAIDIRLEDPRIAHDETASLAPRRGRDDAKVVITEFADFQCDYCRDGERNVNRILDDFGNDVALVYRHLPLAAHPAAFSAAQASFCAGEQGHFWEYHDALLRGSTVTPELLDRTATALKLDSARFGSCRASEASRLAVIADMQEAKRLGVSDTPTFVINGKIVRGAHFDELQHTVLDAMSASAAKSRS